MILVSTIWHTGTHNLVNHKWGNGALQNIAWMHCVEGVRDFLHLSGIVTTYRQPERVAASWINRDKFTPKLKAKDLWREQWKIWADIIVPKAQVISVNDLPTKVTMCNDRWNLHRYLNDSNLDSYYKIVPRWAIEYAQNYVDQVGEYLPKNLITQ